MAELRASWEERDTLSVSGPDARSYLHGQLSQDVEGLEVGESAWSFVLQPAGKVDALVRVWRADDETFLVDVDAGHGDKVASRLDRFKLRTKCTIEPVTRRYLIVRGADVRPAAEGAVALVAGWGDPTPADGVDLAGVDFDSPVALDESPWAEASRIRGRFPRMSAELDESVIPAESGFVDRAVSFTKGCFTGQELVARIDSRGGNVPRRLRLLVSDSPVEAGAELTIDGAGVGRVTSAADAPEGGSVALGYVKRAVVEGSLVQCGHAAVEVVS